MKTNFLKVHPLKVTVNSKELMRSIVLSKSPNMTDQVTEFITPTVEKAQQKLIREFTQHPVTKEINSGPEASNSSGLLGGYGNLFSFLGFYYGSDPTGPIYDILKEKISVSCVRRGDQGKFIAFIRNAPTKEAILNATPFDWLQGRSWVDGIEHGVSGLGQYIYNEDGFKGANLRSTTGIQIKGKAGAGKLQNTSYISALINDFKKRIGA